MAKNATNWPVNPKKLIEFGWNSPSPIFLRDNLAQVEKIGFGGVGIKIPEEAGSGFIFDVKKPTGASPRSICAGALAPQKEPGWSG
jgi:hypothetical protein